MKYVWVMGVSALLVACAPQHAPIAAGDTSQVSMHVLGRYRGTLPCADCSGIETTLQLREDGHYTLTETYLGRGKPFVSQGQFAWDATGRRITLDDAANRRVFKVEEGQLRQLDLEGHPITGGLAEAYVLTR